MRHTIKLLVAALLAALTVGLAQPAARAATSGVNDWSCDPSAAHPRPVVLLHGLGAQGEWNWSFHAPKIAAAGYCVFYTTYGEATSGFGGSAPITESSQEIADFIDEVLAATGAAEVDLVGHSEGAFQSLYVPKFTSDRVGNVVALAPPTHGTTVQGLVTLGQILGGQAMVDFFTKSARCYACSDLVVGGAAVNALNTGPIAQPGVNYTVIATRYDAVVTPTSTGFVNEPGVRNYYVQQKCPFDPVGHVGIAVDSGITSMILNGLDPAAPIRCGFGPMF